MTELRVNHRWLCLLQYLFEVVCAESLSLLNEGVCGGEITGVLVENTQPLGVVVHFPCT